VRGPFDYPKFSCLNANSSKNAGTSRQIQKKEMNTDIGYRVFVALQFLGQHWILVTWVIPTVILILFLANLKTREIFNGETESFWLFLDGWDSSRWATSPLMKVIWNFWTGLSDLLIPKSFNHSDNWAKKSGLIMVLLAATVGYIATLISLSPLVVLLILVDTLSLASHRKRY